MGALFTMNRRLPLVVILGSTGTGKTKLSLELAQKFGGEIISADSMQIYKGLDIITAKATKEEQSVAPHHLLDIAEPQQNLTVFDYRKPALETIDKLFSENKLPIVVGGTNYYIESILWRILIEDSRDKPKTAPHLTDNKDHELSSGELHKKLHELDPAMAKRLHPNNKRKILRSLEVLYQQGKKHSDILKEQQSSQGGSLYGGGLRYPNALIFKLQCDQNVLDERLNKRVDKMVEEGLVEELTGFHRRYNEERLQHMEADYTRGIFQSIGFKEFHPFLIMSDTERDSDLGRATLEKCIDELKLVTRRYARRQNKWVMNRFLARRDREVPSLYGLDTSNVEEWNKNVTIPAFEIVENYFNNVKSAYEPLPIQMPRSAPNAEDETNFCEVCERIFVGNLQWSVHKKSHIHRKRLSKKNKLLKEEQERMEEDNKNRTVI